MKSQSIKLKNITAALLLIGASSTLFSQPTFQVSRGVRPVIPLSAITQENTLPKTVRIKFTPESQRTLRIKKVRKTGTIKTNINCIDSLNRQFGATEIVPTFADLYNTKSRAVQSQRARHEAWGFDRWYDITISSDSLVEAIAAYRKLTEVTHAEPIYRKVRDSYRDETDSSWTPDDPEFKDQWHYENSGQGGGVTGADINLLEAWKYERGFEEVLVAVVDGGIDQNHPDLMANLWEGKGFNFVDKNDIITADYHGTHVSGTVAAVSNNGIGVSGIAGGSGTGDGVRMMSCQIFTATSFGGTAEALIWAADNGATISQNSWGYGDSLVYNQSDLDAIDYFNANGGGAALASGVSFFSAGNRGKEGTYYPGCYEGAFSVAATDNKDKMAVYSNHGEWVDIAAPGGDIGQTGVLSTYPGGSYKHLDGTSMACPHVSGVAALIISAAYRNGVVLTADQLKEILQKSADDIFDPSQKSKLGAGRLNAGKAMEYLNNTYLTSLQPPYTMVAEALSYSEVALQWNSNDNTMPVLVTASTSKEFSAPVSGATYSVGDKIGDATVVYAGIETTTTHKDLEAGDTLYYRAYSYNNSQEYSGYRSCFAVTDHFTETGTADDPYQINTLEELQVISEFPRYWDNHIRLNYSINASETQNWNRGAGWNPIGNEKTPFSGTFMGGGHTIDSLYISKTSEFNALFGFIEGGTVDSLGVTNLNYNGAGYTAGFVGKLNPGTITNSFAIGEVNGQIFTGGFAGLLKEATVENCYAQVTIKGGMYVGGFSGSCYTTNIKNCYSIGAVTAENSSGGFIGMGAADPSCYWAQDVAQVSTSKGGTSKSSAEMKVASTFSGWDFSNTWEILDDNSYPVLAWEKNDTDATEITVTEVSSFGSKGLFVEKNPVRQGEMCRVMVEVGEPASIELVVYDHLGSILDKSEVLYTQKGAALYQWDLRNQYGSDVGGGAYLLQAKIEYSSGKIETINKLIGVIVE